MTLYDYTSRNIPSPKVFSNVLETRLQAKADGDEATSNALKLVVNTTYGASLNRYNALYDPLMGRSVCITGQLFLLELAMNLHQNVENLRIVQLNTDGIMIEFDTKEQAKVTEIVDEWQARTGFELEEDEISAIYQKDVNNYIEVQSDGKVKKKGGYLVRGVSTRGAFNVNNSASIVAKAIEDYFVKGTPPEETIENCDDIFAFQLIAKAGTKYNRVYHLVNGEEVPVQKVNRVYATKDEKYGKLYKVKAENGSVAKIAALPEHCVIDNKNELTIDAVDKSFYLDMAKKRIRDFTGRKTTRRKKSVAQEKAKNVYEKLLDARVKFLHEGVTKSGKHMELRFKYFELDDIVPIAMRIFSEVGIVPVVSFTEELACMDIVNIDNPEEVVRFSSPMRYPRENKMVHPVQALGGAQTYLRRYLYMMALDICEPDQIEPSTGAETRTPPASEEERAEIKSKLTAPNEMATDLQIKSLKNVLQKLGQADPTKEEMIASIAVKTKGFTNITKADCEELIERINVIIDGVEKQ